MLMRRVVFPAFIAAAAFAFGIFAFVQWQSFSASRPGDFVDSFSSNYEAGTTERAELLPASVNFKYGFVNRSGEIVVPTQFEWASDFSEGLALFKQDGKWGFIDSTGKVAIEPQIVDGVEGSLSPEFHEGRARVSGFSMRIGPALIVAPRMGYIDRSGKVFWMDQY